MPRMRALPALRISVRPLAPRKENWMSFQSSWKSAPLKRRRCRPAGLQAELVIVDEIGAHRAAACRAG